MSAPTAAPANKAVQDEERALARAFVYRFLSSAFRYPDQAACETMDGLRPGAGEALLALASSHGELSEKLFGELNKFLEQCDGETLDQDYVKIFGHAPGGNCPAYEGEYGQGKEPLQQPHELSDLSAFYRAFGLTSGGEAHERVDFIAVELEFLSFLCQKQAYGIEHSDNRLAELSFEGQQKFMKNHLGRWVPSFARRLSEYGEGGFYGILAQFTLDFVLVEAKLLGVKTGSNDLRILIPEFDAEACMNCPAAEGQTEGISDPSELSPG